MATQSEKTRWKSWADGLRQEMMVQLTPEVTKSVEAICAETGSSKSMKTLEGATYWRSCQAGVGANDSISAAGFEIQFEVGEDKKVSEVTLKLNSTWRGIMQRVLDRQR